MFLKRQPKSRIDLACPACGFAQSEPGAVVSTFCRHCGEHYRVRRGKVVVRSGVKPSGIVKPLATALPGRVPVFAPASPGSEASTGAEASWLLSAEDGESAPRTLEPSPLKETESALSAGAFFGFATAAQQEARSTDGEQEGSGAKSKHAPGDPDTSDEAAEASTGKSDDESDDESDETSAAEVVSEGSAYSLGEKAVGRSELASGSVAALIESQRRKSVTPISRMPAHYLPQEERRHTVPALSDFEARCFRCFHANRVSRYAKSTQCERCSTYISLADYEIRARLSHTLRTRGNIVILRRGGLKDCEIACHHLTVDGAIDARVDCSGDAVFRKSGRVRGHLHCRKLILEKGTEVEFPDGAKAERAEIHGRLAGDLTCSGLVRVFRSGSISGRLVAASMEIKDGGLVEGETHFDPETDIAPNPVSGYSSPIIG